MKRDALVDSALSAFVFDRATLVMLVTDLEGTILRANRYAEELVGEPLGGRRLSDIVVDFSSTFDLRRAVAAQASVLLDVTTESGVPRTLCFSFVDCNEHYLVVGELTHHEDQALRTNLIVLNGEVSNLNRELQKKTVELERTNEMKNRFIGMAAHDLRNPIGGIRELSDILREEATATGDESHAEVFAMIRESSGFMLALIEDLLTAITIESGEMRLNAEMTDLNELVASTVRLNRVLSGKKNVRLVLQQGPLPEARLDRMKVRQILNNLISNAVKFSPNGGVVTVVVDRHDTDAAISVSDAGPGIPSDEFHKLFKPFSRTTVTAPDGEKSSGLGLSIAKKIVEEHGGSIRVESEVGVGTTFHVSLPLVIEQDAIKEEFTDDER